MKDKSSLVIAVGSVLLSLLAFVVPLAITGIPNYWLLTVPAAMVVAVVVILSARRVQSS